MEEGNNNIASYIIVSDDNYSKKVPVYKSTNFDDFYTQILNLFPKSFNYKRQFFYYEGYSHEKNNISNDKEFIIANRKNIDYLYFCPNYSNYCLMNEDEENNDYLKYHSVITFCPIEILNTEFQNNQRKEMKINFNKDEFLKKYKNNNNQNINKGNINPKINNNYQLMRNMYLMMKYMHHVRFLKGNMGNMNMMGNMNQNMGNMNMMGNMNQNMGNMNIMVNMNQNMGNMNMMGNMNQNMGNMNMNQNMGNMIQNILIIKNLNIKYNTPIQFKKTD